MSKGYCKVCGIKTPRKLRGLILDNAPVLDHIMPLSKGGTHTYDNVQCLCRKCNQLKSDSIMPEYLMNYISTQGAQDGLFTNQFL